MFATAFEIARGSNGIYSDLIFRLAIGVCTLIVGIFLAWKGRRDRITRQIAPWFFIAWSVYWLWVHDFPRAFGQIDDLVAAYRSGRYEVVEGPVKVLHLQPATGHTRGDVIVVGGGEFEVNYFLATPAYRDTLAHGGVLKEGVYARIYHRGGAILRVDIKGP